MAKMRETHGTAWIGCNHYAPAMEDCCSKRPVRETTACHRSGCGIRRTASAVIRRLAKVFSEPLLTAAGRRGRQPPIRVQWEEGLCPGCEDEQERRRHRHPQSPPQPSPWIAPHPPLLLGGFDLSPSGDFGNRSLSDDSPNTEYAGYGCSSTSGGEEDEEDASEADMRGWIREKYAGALADTGQP